MKTFTDIKKKFVVGQEMIMLDHSIKRDNPLLNIVRKIKTVQSNAIQFEPHVEGKQGSWFYFPKATQIQIINDQTFRVNFDGGSGYMTYSFVNKG